MMNVIFYDKMRETYTSQGNVILLESVMLKCNGRLTNVWKLTLQDGKIFTFKQKDYSIYRVEI